MRTRMAFGIVSRWRPFSGEAAEPPEAVPGQGEGQDEVDAGFRALQGPVPAGGLVGDGDPYAPAGQAVREGGSGPAAARRWRASRWDEPADGMPCCVGGAAGPDPGLGLAGQALRSEREGEGVRRAG